MSIINGLSDSILLKLKSIPGVIKSGELTEELKISSNKIPNSFPALMLRLVTSETLGACNNGVQPLSLEWEIAIVVGNLSTLEENNRVARNFIAPIIFAFEKHLVDSQDKLVEKAGRLNFQGMQPLQLNQAQDGLIAAYSLKFTQKVWLGNDRREDFKKLPEPLGIHVGHEPKIGLKHRDEYIKIGEVGKA
ncbi:hypothetical protein [Microbulbifer sp. THAF38]|uniref:hypothetical protein n=1 Tax=Microbulbifer sp. THAF38 TaxID=2587856 RepID=UPI001267EC34|nr:hypothetical protein [Microbulbifer sp. THAF38]QFT56608.1 hypothetical protein FIU95_18835 [Microbulbifer sp. THAF38]